MESGAALVRNCTGAGNGGPATSNSQPGAPAAPVQQVQVMLVGNGGPVVQVQSSPQFNPNQSAKQSAQRNAGAR